MNSASMSDLPASDILGFPVTAEEQQRLVDPATVAANQKCKEKWASFVQQGILPPPSRLKRLVRKYGVPHSERSWVWPAISGALELKAQYPSDYFARLVVDAQTNSKSIQQIDLDMPRTFPEHPWIKTQEGQTTLRNVLLAYSVHDQKAGYCQGLNFVASVLLLATGKNPETAFWLLVALITRILYPNMYAQWLPGFQIEMKALNILVKKKLPRLHSHLQDTGCDMCILATDWFLCVFVKTLTHDVSLRVLDCIFSEGAKILFRLSLAILKTNQQKLMKHDNAGELVEELKAGVAAIRDVDALLDAGFNSIGGLPIDKINKYRRRCKPEIDEMVRQRDETQRQHEERQRQLEAERAARRAS